MQSYNPAIPGHTLSRLFNGRFHVHKKNAGKPRVLAINAIQHSPAALAATFMQSYGFLFLSLIMMHSHRQSDFCANSMFHETDPG